MSDEPERVSFYLCPSVPSGGLVLPVGIADCPCCGKPLEKHDTFLLVCDLDGLSIVQWSRECFDLQCQHYSPDGERCNYALGHDLTGEPHSWTQFGIGFPGIIREHHAGS